MDKYNCQKACPTKGVKEVKGITGVKAFKANTGFKGIKAFGY